MDIDALLDITRRYSPLDRMVSAFFSSSNDGVPAGKMTVSLGTAMADEAFERLVCCTADGKTSRLRSRDRRMEGRQLALLLSYDAKHRRLGAHAWDPGPPGSPKDVLGRGAFGKRAADFALVIHREWFKPGCVPIGIPDMKTAPSGLERAELEIHIFGRTGTPSTWNGPR